MTCLAHFAGRRKKKVEGRLRCKRRVWNERVSVIRPRETTLSFARFKAFFDVCSIRHAAHHTARAGGDAASPPPHTHTHLPPSRAPARCAARLRWRTPRRTCTLTRGTTSTRTSPRWWATGWRSAPSRRRRARTATRCGAAAGVWRGGCEGRVGVSARARGSARASASVPAPASASHARKGGEEVGPEQHAGCAAG